jgi:uncharacterized protein
MAIYYVWLALLVVANTTAWLSNLVSLPGNWLIVAVTAVFAAVFPEDAGRGIGWTAVAILAALALAGEVLEFVAGAAVAGKRGGSRRGMVLAIVGTILGSLSGALVSLPVPLLGPILGALGGGVLGAFIGAWAGEIWKGRSWDAGIQIATAAVIGRLLGTAGKLILGAMMVVIAAVDACY